MDIYYSAILIGMLFIGAIIICGWEWAGLKVQSDTLNSLNILFCYLYVFCRMVNASQFT